MKDFISETIDRLKKANSELTQSIASGVNIHDFSTYQKFIGQRQGIQEALDIINQILSEDEEDQS